MPKRLVAGNWKMNGLETGLAQLHELAPLAGTGDPTILICPPATLLHRMSQELRGTGIETGGQDCHQQGSGAHTGDVSAAMIADAGATHCIVGHSERRADHREPDGLIRCKVEASISAGLRTILCVGESEEERLAEQTDAVLTRQLAACIPDSADETNLVVAYEPVWAIGTGRTATASQIKDAHASIRRKCAELLGRTAADGLTIVYGGSVNPANAREIFAIDGVDGGLVGGASLKSSDFAAIIKSFSG